MCFLTLNHIALHQIKLFLAMSYDPFNDSIFIEQKCKQKIVPTLLKWLFWTSINVDILKKINI